MGNKSKMSYSDEEGSLCSKPAMKYLEGEKISRYTEQEGIQPLPKGLYEHIKTCCSSRLKQMKKRANKIYSA